MNFFKNLSFKVKLIALCLFMSAISIIIGGVAYNGLHQVSDTYEKISTQVMPKLEEANDMYVAFGQTRVALRTLGLPGITSAQAAESVKGAQASIAAYEESAKVYESYGFIPGQKELYAESQAAWTQFKGVGAKVLALQKSGSPEDHEAMGRIFFKDCHEAADAYNIAMGKLLEFHKDVGQKRTLEAKAVSDGTNTRIFLIAIVGVLLGLSIGTIFATTMSRSISEVTDNLAQSAAQVTAASAQIASSSEELSQAATEQASSLEETAASLEQISAMISKAADSAETTSERSNESQQKAEEGRVAVDQMLSSINEISQSNEAIMNQITESNQQMTEIVRVIQEIGNKTKVINEIVFQTKLLSFNASVEAARAGEHGKGFAVVAEEVGNLAQMSGNAAKEISDMLESSITKVETIVRQTKTGVESLIEQGKRKVESGVTVAKQCSDVLNDIVQNVTKVSSLAQEISQASKEQAQGVIEINKAMGQLDAVTQQNSATSEETASAAEELSAQAETLKTAVDGLVETVQGHGKNKSMAMAGGAAMVRKSNSTVNRAGSHQSNSSSPSNIIHIKSSPKFREKGGNGSAAGPGELKAASGDDFIPNRNDDGFRDV